MAQIEDAKVSFGYEVGCYADYDLDHKTDDLPALRREIKSAYEDLKVNINIAGMHPVEGYPHNSTILLTMKGEDQTCLSACFGRVSPVQTNNPDPEDVEIFVEQAKDIAATYFNEELTGSPIFLLYAC